MLIFLILLAILTLIFAAGLPPSIALILCASVISGAVVTYWFSRGKKPARAVVEAEANSKLRQKAS